MSQQKYPKAYEAYQQAVYRDGKNPTFWCSIGVLYYQINQYRDALDAYSRAIRFNPYISEVWYDLGTLYESCNNQTTDALDAYQRAAELDPSNPHIKARLNLLRQGPTNGGPPPAAPQPADVHPHAYQAAGPVGPQWGGSTQQQNVGQPQPADPRSGETWAGRLSNVNPPSQPQNSYDGRGEHFRAPPAPPLRQPSPMAQDPHARGPYADPQRGAPPRRGHSPPPPSLQYGGPPPPPPPPSQAPQRVMNPHYRLTPSATEPVPNGANGHPPPNGMPPFRATNSPRPDGRHHHDSRMSSPRSGYGPHQAPPPHYPHHPEVGAPSNPENGPPLPPPVGEGPRIDERPASVASKRMREWEEETPVKKQASEENRARLEDTRPQRASTPPQEPFSRPSPETRRTDEPRRIEEPRRPEETRRTEEPREYHPSEAAHHPQTHSVGVAHLPAMQTPTAEKSAVDATPGEERPPAEQASGPPSVPPAEQERAARKMEVDEDYDDSGDEDKKTAAITNGSGPSSSSGEAKAASPTSGSVNGASGPTTKTET